ncbi:hypothetical protein [Hyphococcus sp.]|uniref:hypothetical protein n=1 Tax=Hyphococcus sp. TaxID=2038636 RepID=UPI003CCC2C84
MQREFGDSLDSQSSRIQHLYRPISIVGIYIGRVRRIFADNAASLKKHIWLDRSDFTCRCVCALGVAERALAGPELALGATEEILKAADATQHGNAASLIQNL